MVVEFEEICVLLCVTEFEGYVRAPYCGQDPGQSHYFIVRSSLGNIEACFHVQGEARVTEVLCSAHCFVF